MILSLIQELLDTAAELSAWAERRQAATASLAPLEAAADRVAKAWSGSPIGYHSCVYYRDFRQPPAGAHFSPEWGLEDYSWGSTGEWQPYEYGAVLQHIYSIAGNPDLSEPEEISKGARAAFEEGKSQLLSVLTALLRAGADSFLESIKAEVEKEIVLTRPQAMRAQLPSGSIWSRDSLAMSQGIRTAPHQEIYAEVVSLRAPFTECEKLASLARRAAHHMQRVVRTGKENSVTASRVFIGHGRSAAWRDLKDSLSERLSQTRVARDRLLIRHSFRSSCPPDCPDQYILFVSFFVIRRYSRSVAIVALAGFLAGAGQR